MLKVPEPKTGNPHESTWDHHGSYQWTYFAQEIKQRIQYFLLQRLNGKNIEVGGGWYLSYPNSVVVDLSSVCLEHNPAKEKLQFDLDTIGESGQLPYGDDSFNSATLISVWQYLRHPRAVLRELERVLRPGGEIYLINGQGAGLEECIVGSTRTEGLQQFFQELGYDTLIEHIPEFDGRVSEFQSVCVAMPDSDLFGKTHSRVRNKTQRKKQDEEICQNPAIFLKDYRDWEMGNQLSRLAKLSTFPVTRFSQEYLKRIEEFSQKYNQETGGIPLAFIEQGFEPELAMLLPEDELPLGMLFFMGNDEPLKEDSDNREEKILRRPDLSFSRYFNYFDHPTTKELLGYCERFQLEREDRLQGRSGNETELIKFTDFLASLALNSFTRELQAQMYERLQPNVPDLDERVQRQRTFGYSLATQEYKQRRSIDRMIKAKEKITSNGVPVIGTRNLDYIQFIPNMRQLIR